MKLKIAKNNHVKQTKVMGLRLPLDVIAHLDNIAKQSGRTRKELIVMCIDNLELEGDE